MSNNNLNSENKLFSIVWNKSLNEKIIKGELICSFEIKHGSYKDFMKNKIYASENCILIKKNKNKDFIKNQVVGYVRAFNNDLDFKNLQLESKKTEQQKQRQEEKRNQLLQKREKKSTLLVLLMILYFVVVIIWDGEGLDEPESWWLFIFPGYLILVYLLRFLLQMDD